jgi:hypothetical protein
MAVLLIGSPYGFNMDERHAGRHTRLVTFILHDRTPFNAATGKLGKTLVKV